MLFLWSDGRLSDLDEDGSLAAEEFGIAFHLIFCATQHKLNVPDELPQRFVGQGLYGDILIPSVAFSPLSESRLGELQSVFVTQKRLQACSSALEAAC